MNKVEKDLWDSEPLTAFFSSFSRAAASVLNYPRSIDPDTANSSSSHWLTLTHSDATKHKKSPSFISFSNSEDIKRRKREKLAPRPARLLSLGEGDPRARARPRTFLTVHLGVFRLWREGSKETNDLTFGTWHPFLLWRWPCTRLWS